MSFLIGIVEEQSVGGLRSSPGVGSITWSGHMPVTIIEANGFHAAPGHGAVTWTGPAPSYLITGTEAFNLVGYGNYGFALDVSDLSAYIKDENTPANDTNVSASLADLSAVFEYDGHAKIIRDSGGTLQYQPHNYFLNSTEQGGGNVVTQDITVINGADYKIVVTGTVEITVSGAFTGTATAASPLTGTATTTTLTCTVSVAAVTNDTVQVHRDPMTTGYVQTGNDPVFLLPVEYHAGGWATRIAIENTAATNLFLDNRNAATQNITVSAQAYTISFYGTGSITLSGTATATLQGLAAGFRKVYTFTPTAGTLTCTVSGSVDLVQVEAGNRATTPIETYASAVTRPADDCSIATTAFPHSATVNVAMVEYAPYDDSIAGYGLRWDDETANERVDLGHNASALVALSVTDGGAAQTAPLATGGVASGGMSRISAKWKANDFMASDMGGTAATDTSGTLPTVTRLKLGDSVARFLIRPADLNATQVAALSAPEVITADDGSTQLTADDGSTTLEAA